MVVGYIRVSTEKQNAEDEYAFQILTAHFQILEIQCQSGISFPFQATSQQ